jgi:hypothetical protein
MNRAEYNVWRKNANKLPEDFVDLDEEWDERDASHCVKCWENEPHPWLEHDESIDHMRKDRRMQK